MFEKHIRLLHYLFPDILLRAGGCHVGTLHLPQLYCHMTAKQAIFSLNKARIYLAQLPFNYIITQQHQHRT